MLYDNRGLSVYPGEFGKVFSSIKGKWETGLDVLLAQGIRTTNHNTPIGIIYESQIGLFHGQSGKRNPFFCSADSISYLAIAGSSSSDIAGERVSNADMIKILSEQSNPLKFVYEKSGQQVASQDQQSTCYILTNLQRTIDLIRGTLDTGKIPFLSLDTINNTASDIYAVELLAQYCYYNDIEIVTVEEARMLANKYDWNNKSNYFPNPNFNQSILKMFGGSSELPQAYRPDSWQYLEGSNITYSVTRANGKGTFAMTSSGTGDKSIAVRMFGLPSGKYQIKFTAKSTGSHGRIVLQEFKNGTNVRTYNSETIFYDNHIETTDTEYMHNFTIKEPIVDLQNTPASAYADGYENNAVELRFIMGFAFGDTSASEETISIHDISLERL